MRSWTLREPTATYEGRKLWALHALVLQNTSLVLLIKHSYRNGAPAYSSVAVVFLSELVKLLVCCIVIAWTSGIKCLWQGCCDVHRHWKLLLPSLLYVVQNNSHFVALRNLSALVYIVCSQSKILTTVFFSVLLLKSEITRTRYVGLTLLTSGLILVQISSTNVELEPRVERNTSLGLAAVALASLISGFVSVYLEKIYKVETYSVWERNLQLGVLSLPFATLSVLLDTNFKFEFIPRDSVIIAVIVLKAIGGLVVAFVVKYADSILKNFSVAVSICCCVIYTLMTGEQTLDIANTLGVVCVILSMFIYSHSVTDCTPSLTALRGSGKFYRVTFLIAFGLLFILERTVYNAQQRVHTQLFTAVSTILLSSTGRKLQQDVPFYMYDDLFLQTIRMSECFNLNANVEDIWLLRLLVNHTSRVENSSMARVHIIPFSLHMSYERCPDTHGDRMDEYFTRVTASEAFQRNNGNDHLLLGFDWKLSAWSPVSEIIFPVRWRYKLQNVTMTRFEVYGLSKWMNSSRDDPQFLSFHPTSLLQSVWEITKRAVVVPYVSSVPLATNIDYVTWRKREYLCAYFSRSSGSAHGGTVLRHLPQTRPEFFKDCKIGFEVPHEEWLNAWSKSKYCFVIRGDTPTSHAFSNALSAGCIPVIISDTFELVGLPFVNHVGIQLPSFSIQISEADWLNQTKIVMDKLRKLPRSKIEHVLRGIKTVQPKLLYSHPQSQVATSVLRSLANWQLPSIHVTTNNKRFTAVDMLPFGTCALVLSSGVLKHREYGSLIDENDVVVRFNMAPTRGYERNVGRRTTHMFAWNIHYEEFERVMNTPEYNGTKLVVSPYSWDIAPIYKTGIPPSRYIIPGEHFIADSCKRNWQLKKDAAQYPQRRCSSGVIAVIYFLERCDSLNVFGMYNGSTCEYPTEYFRSDQCNATTDREPVHSHNFTHEHMMMNFYSRSNPKLNLF